MSRRHISFRCDGVALAATIDDGDATAGLLLATGGNEIRSGAWGSQAELAARLAAEGFPVFRYDNPGTGDSEGFNGGFKDRIHAVRAALEAFRREKPGLSRIVAMGNCDAASTLMLTGGEGLDALVLSNPWTIEQEDAAPPPEAVRDHYRRRLTDPRAMLRLLTGKVSIGKLAASLRDALKAAPLPTGLAQDMAAGIAAFPGDVRFLIAARDRTAQAFLAAWDKDDPRIRHCPEASHSFVEPHARDWLAEQVLEVLRG